MFGPIPSTRPLHMRASRHAGKGTKTGLKGQLRSKRVAGKTAPVSRFMTYHLRAERLFEKVYNNDGAFLSEEQRMEGTFSPSGCVCVWVKHFWQVPGGLLWSGGSALKRPAWSIIYPHCPKSACRTLPEPVSMTLSPSSFPLTLAYLLEIPMTQLSLRECHLPAEPPRCHWFSPGSDSQVEGPQPWLLRLAPLGTVFVSTRRLIQECQGSLGYPPSPPAPPDPGY